MSVSTSSISASGFTLYVIATMPIISPQGPTNPHSEQMYATPWSRQRGLRPIEKPQFGHGKAVEPTSVNGLPEDVQFFARSVIVLPLL